MNFLSSISRNTWIIIAVVILVIILVIYFARKPKTITTTTTVTTPIVPSYTGTNNFPLQNGSVGDNVKKWQKYLNTKGAGLTEDGIWGPLTDAASLKYMGFNSVTETYFNQVIK